MFFYYFRLFSSSLVILNAMTFMFITRMLSIQNWSIYLIKGFVCAYIHDYSVISGSRANIKFTIRILQDIYLNVLKPLFSNHNFFAFIYWTSLALNHIRTKEQKLHMMGFWIKVYRTWEKKNNKKKNNIIHPFAREPNACLRTYQDVWNETL